MKKLFLIVFTFCIMFSLYAQNGQSVRGRVIDKDAKYPLPVVFVFLLQDTIIITGEATDMEGEFIFTHVKPGRYRLECRNIGYYDVVMPITVTKGKEVYVELQMEESITELSVSETNAYDKSGTVNEMALASSRMFDSEEANRYAGSRADPARMAANYAGVQGADDSRNDIIVRGNSPGGILWRLEGINIPSPNHFTVPGTSGSPITMLNNKTLANSDFHTGAFAAEFGNTTSGVFDLKFKKGNPDNYEHSFLLGVLGVELLSEGPINKEKRSSYLVAYRYSTIKMVTSLGIDIGTSAIPTYQDLMFKLNFPMKNNANITVFGLGGISDINTIISTDPDTTSIDLYSDQNRDSYFSTRTGIAGVSYSKNLNEKVYVKSVLATTGSIVDVYHEGFKRKIGDDGKFEVIKQFDLLDYDFRKSKISNATYINIKKDKKNFIKTGWIVDFNRYDYYDSLYKESTDVWNTRVNYQGNAFLIQPFIQWRHKFSNKFVTNIGWNAQYYTLNNTYSFLEPRASAKYQVTKNKWLSFGLGLHSQLQTQFNYFTYSTNESGENVLANFDMEMTKSFHSVVGYDHQFTRNLRLKAETYYQYLYNIPVEKNRQFISLINEGGGFSRYFPNQTVNEGIGRNYGFELTVEKFFSKSYFLLASGSLYDSEYQGLDKVWRNTDWNSNFVINVVGGVEKPLGKGFIGLSAKVTWAGGRRHGKIDSLETAAQGEIDYLADGYNEFQFKDYFRTDLKLKYNLNGKKVAHEIAIDIVNVFNTQNILTYSYLPIEGSNANPFRETYQLGFLPFFYYKLDF